MTQFHSKKPPSYKQGLMVLIFFLTLFVFTSNGSPWREADDQFNYARHLLQTGSISQVSYPHIGHMKGINGKFYDCHGLANIVVFLVPLAFEPILEPLLGEKTLLFLRLLSVLSGALFAAFALWAFYLIVIQLGYKQQVAIHGSLSLGLTTVLWPYSAMNYEINLFVCFTLFAFYFYIKNQESQDIGATLAMVSFAGLSLLTRDFSLIFCGLLGVFFLHTNLRACNYQKIVVAILGFLPWVFVWSYYNYIRTGHFLLSPILFQTFSGVEHYQVLAPKHSIWRGLSVFLFSPGGSLFIYSPLLIIGFFEARKSFIKHKTITLFILIYSILILAFSAKIGNFFGSPGFGPRYLVGIVPFLFLLALPFFEKLTKTPYRWKKNALCSLYVFGFILQVSAALTFWKARVPFLHQPGTMRGMWTLSGSQWLDTIQMFFSNILGALTGKTSDIQLLEMSEPSAYAAKTVFTWWSRLYFMGVPGSVILAYLVVTLIVIVLCFRQLVRVSS